MRRVILNKGEQFSNKHLKRTGAFNARAMEAATSIIEQVREQGDAALRELTERFDGVAIENFRVPAEAIEAAAAKVDPKTEEALKKAAKQIREFHERQVKQSWFSVREDGALVGAKVTPLESVGIYVPGGRALYPSTVLMNALPAAVAGVERIVCVTPPTKDGSIDPVVLEACRLAGVTEIYTVGGAQAVAALACILYLRRMAPETLIRRGDCRMDRELLGKTARFSFVTGLHQSSLYIGKLLVQGAVNTGGTDMIAAYTATTRIEGFANSFGDSGASAISVLVAQNRGAEKEDRVRETYRSGLVLMLAVGALMSLIMYVSAGATVGFMLGEFGGAAFENARSYMRLVAVFYVLCFTGNVFAGYFDGIGRVSIPFVGATTHITLRVILSWLLVGRMGLRAVALATGLGWVLVNLMWTVIKHRLDRRAAERQSAEQS